MINKFEKTKTPDMEKKGIDITNSLEEIKDFWTVSSFMEAYPDTPALKGCAVAAMTDESGNPDKTAIITFRTFLQNGDRAKTDQKFVVGIRFYSFGDMATIDVISLDKGYHKEICYDHLQRMGWPAYEGIKMVDEYSETTRAPFLFVGGHMKIADDEKTNFSDTSGDYGSKTLFTDGNSLAAYAASACGIEIGEGDKEKGEAFVQEIMQFMLKHKTQKDFYEKLVAETTEKTDRHARPFTPQNIGALMTMKVADRVIEEGGDPMQTMVQEMSGGGLGSAILVNSVVKNMRDRESDEKDGL